MWSSRDQGRDKKRSGADRAAGLQIKGKEREGKKYTLERQIENEGNGELVITLRGVHDHAKAIAHYFWIHRMERKRGRKVWSGLGAEAE